jgi:tripartite motif-containing protein 71
MAEESGPETEEPPRRPAEGGEDQLGLRAGEVPPVRYHEGGVIQTEPKLRVIFWGSNFNLPTGSALREQLLKMYSGLSGTAYQGLLTQYFSGSSYLTQHITVESFTDTSEAAPHIEDPKQLGKEIEEVRKLAGWGLASNPQVQYDIVTAPGSTYGGNFAEGYCAFHGLYGEEEENVYAFVPYAGDAPFSTTNNCPWYGKGSAADATSSLASHEYAESATDPFWDDPVKFGWQNLEGYEVSDLCATPGAKLPNGSFVQSQYDDHENACSLADETAPHILASTDTATGVSSLGAVLHGTVNPEGSATTYQLEFGTSKAYGSKLFPTEREAGSGRGNVAFSGTMGALTPETVYHYRVAAKNANGTTYGEDRTIIPSKWRVQAPPGQAGWSWNWLNGVSCWSLNSCEAVGHTYSGGNIALAAGRVGSEWVPQTAPVPAGSESVELLAVSCPSSTYCVAVGYVYVGGKWNALIDRWNGSAWSLETLAIPPGAIGLEMSGVSCAAAGECIAVGAEEISPEVWANYSARLAGGTWTKLSTPTASEASGRISGLTDVSCSAVANCMAVGWYNTGKGSKPFSELWTGSAWSLQLRSRTGWFEGVSCVSAEFCMAAGNARITEEWNGSEWVKLTTPSAPDVGGGYLTGISCISSNDCAAAGAGYSLLNPEQPVTLAETWNGSAWSEQTTPRESEMAWNEIAGLSCTSLGACTSVGLSKASGDFESLTESRPNEFTMPAYSAKVGTSGSGNGQLSYPKGMAIDGSGNVWVADSVNNRVQEFNEKGEYVRQFGTKGSGAGQFIEPQGVAITASGNLWVTDAGNDRVEEFTPEGKYLAQFGSEGYLPGHFYEPWGIAITSSGNIWVSDARYYRIEEFNSAGGFIREVHGAGWGGTGNGEFSYPTGVAIDSAGNVWVADQGHSRIQEFGPNGEFITKFGELGTSAGKLKEPQGVAVKPSGDLLVADSENGKIKEFTLSGEYVATLSPAGAPALSWPIGIAVGTGGVEYVSDSSAGRLQRWYQPAAPAVLSAKASNLHTQEATLGATVYPGSLDTKYRIEYGKTTAYGQRSALVDLGEGKAGTTITQAMTGLAPNTEYHARVVATSAGGVTKSSDVAFSTLPVSYVSAFGSLGTGNGQFEIPADLAIDGKGNLWVLDDGNSRVQEFTEEGKFERTFGTHGAGAGQLGWPGALALDGKGNMWIADSSNNRIEKFSEEGKFLMAIGSAGTGNGQFNYPEGIAVDSHGNVWVSDTYNSRLEEFNENGEFIRTVGSYGTGPGHFEEPTGISGDSHGNVWVTDWGTCQVSEFNEKGEFVQRFGSFGTGNGQFYEPDDVVVDSRGTVWVGDVQNNRVQGFNEKGEFLTKFGTKGTGPGQFKMSYPMGITTNASGGIWVSDVQNERVEHWSY